MRIGFIQAQGNDSRSYGIPLCFGYIAAVLKAEWDRPFEFRITSEPYDLVELQIDDAHALTFRKLHSDKWYSFTCSEGFLGGTHRTETLAEYGADDGRA